LKVQIQTQLSALVNFKLQGSFEEFMANFAAKVEHYQEKINVLEENKDLLMKNRDSLEEQL